MAKYNVKQFNSGKALQKAREMLDLSQGQFAYKVGYKRYAEYEGRNTSIGIKTYMEWADKLDCDIDFLLGVQNTKRKEADDICSLTGLDETAIDLMKRECAKPQLMKVVDRKDVTVDWKETPENMTGVSSGVTTADLINGLSGQSKVGNHFRKTMIWYITESLVCNLLKERIDEIVSKHNEYSDSVITSEDLIDKADAVFNGVRQITSLSSLVMANRVQTGIADDSTNFCDSFTLILKDQCIDKTEARVFFDYLQSKNRLKALEQCCREEVVKFLDEMAVGRQLNYTNSIMGIFDVTSDAQSGNTQRPKDSKKVLQLRAELEEAKKIQKRLIDTNNQLSAELSEARWKIKDLQEFKDHLSEDASELTFLRTENERLQETIKGLLKANNGLDNKNKRLERENKSLKEEIERLKKEAEELKGNN